MICNVKHMKAFYYDNNHSMFYHNGILLLKNKSAFKMVNECFSECNVKILPNMCKNEKHTNKQKIVQKTDKSEFNIPFSKLLCVYKEKKCVCIRKKKLEKMIMHTRTAFITKQLCWYQVFKK